MCFGAVKCQLKHWQRPILPIARTSPSRTTDFIETVVVYAVNLSAGVGCGIPTWCCRTLFRPAGPRRAHLQHRDSANYSLDSQAFRVDECTLSTTGHGRAVVTEVVGLRSTLYAQLWCDIGSQIAVDMLCRAERLDRTTRVVTVFGWCYPFSPYRHLLDKGSKTFFE